jgi:nitrite reductase/ring-hydroxylating ferredoxin subunit
LVQEYFVAGVDEIADGGRRVIEGGGLEIGVFRLGGDYFAWESNCPHQGGPVCQGRIMNRVDEVIDEGARSHGYRFVEEDVHIVCPWHGFEFNIRTGRHPGDPGTQLRGFSVSVRDDGIYVRVE